jgi:hypothetical protein
MAIELAPKRLELLKDMVPTLRAMLWNVNDLRMTLRYQAAADAARTIGVRGHSHGSQIFLFNYLIGSSND